MRNGLFPAGGRRLFRDLVVRLSLRGRSDDLRPRFGHTVRPEAQPELAHCGKGRGDREIRDRVGKGRKDAEGRFRVGRNEVPLPHASHAPRAALSPHPAGAHGAGNARFRKDHLRRGRVVHAAPLQGGTDHGQHPHRGAEKGPGPGELPGVGAGLDLQRDERLPQDPPASEAAGGKRGLGRRSSKATAATWNFF